MKKFINILLFLIFLSSPAFGQAFNSYANTGLQEGDEIALYRSGCGTASCMRNNLMGFLGNNQFVFNSSGIFYTSPNFIRTSSGVGASEYCDENGANCFEAADAGGGGGGSTDPGGSDRTIQFNNASSFDGASTFVYTSAGRVGIGTAIPNTTLHVSGSTTSTAFIGPLTGNSSTATALAANGANCSAGSAPIGVDASGAVESCTDYEEDLLNSAGLAAAINDEQGTGVAVFSSAGNLYSYTVNPSSSGAKGLIVKGFSGQTANLEEWQNSSDSILSFVASSGAHNVPDAVYSAGWNGSTEAPTKNAVYDKIETLSAGGVTSVSGTSNRITSTGGSTPVIDISGSYVGQSSITTTGTLTSGATGSGFTLNFGTSTISGRLVGDNLPQIPGNVILGNPTSSTANTGAIALSSNNLVGRGSTGDVAAITLGSNLSFSGTVLNAAGGSASGSNNSIQFNNASSFAGASTFVYKSALGSLGIGTDDPQTILHLLGNTPNLRIESENTGQPALLSFYGGDTDSAALVWDAASAQLYTGIGLSIVSSVGLSETVINPLSEQYNFRVSGDTDSNLIFTMASSDHVGIGTATPSTKLDVNGTSSLLQILVDGTPPADQTATGFTSGVFNAGTSVSLGTLVYTSADGKYYSADADSSTTATGMLNIALASGSADNPLTVADPGSFVRNDSWNWTAGQILYVSTSAGGMTFNAPSGSADIVRVIGYAKNADVIYFNPDGAWVEVQ